MFNHKRTIEWRLHTPTFNYKKVRNFILIIEAVANFVKNNKDSIINLKKLTINEILDKSDIYLKDELKTYIQYRKDNCTKFSTKDGLVVNPEINNDAKF